jgi:hypothetical protein
MATKRIHWKRERKSRDGIEQLTPEERACIAVALRVLKVRHGSWKPVSKLLGVSVSLLQRAVGKGGRPSAGLAIRVARAAGVPVDDVLTGAFPVLGSCPMCGRSDA